MTRACLILLLALCTQPAAAALISLNFAPGVSAEHRGYFHSAADFWNSAITGYDLIHDAVGAETPHSLNIDVSLPAIDGPGGVLGQAGPDTVQYYDNNPLGAPTLALYYTATGSMEFDSDDVAALVGNQSFFGVVLHEMAHVLGIGTLWSYNTQNGVGVNLYTTGSGQYLGANALAEWQTEFGQGGDGFVPVELGGSSGTADGHWNETDGGGGLTGFVSAATNLDLRYELMTGWASSPFFVSRMTLGALDDLGYQVDYSKSGVVAAVPESSSVVLLGLSACGLWRRRR